MRLLAILASTQSTPGPPPTPVEPEPVPVAGDPTLDDPRRALARVINLTLLDSAWSSGWEDDQETKTISGTIETLAAGVAPSLIMPAYRTNVTYSDMTSTIGGVEHVVTVDGATTFTVPRDTTVETDPIIDGLLPPSKIDYTATVRRHTFSGATAPKIMGKPIQVVGHSTTPAIVYNGDSNHPHYSATPLLPGFTLAQSGSYAPTYSDTYLRQRGFERGGYTHVVVLLGTNSKEPYDLSQFKADYLAHAERLGAHGAKIAQCTIAPSTSSTDGWTTEEGQTLQKPWKVSANAWIRDGLPMADGTTAGQEGHPYAGWIDTAAELENPIGSGLWAAGTYGPSGDGVHHNLNSKLTPRIRKWLRSEGVQT